MKKRRSEKDRSPSAVSCGKGVAIPERKSSNGSGSTGAKGRLASSPLHTLQVARDILAKVCLAGGSAASLSKSCENLHVL